MKSLPIHGQVSYFLADDEIPVSQGFVITPNTMFALYNIGKNQFQVITKEQIKNIDGSRALEIIEMGTYQPNIKEETKMNKSKKSKGILQSVLFEVESVIPPSETDPVVVPDVSLDRKVDKYLTRYEREAIPTSAIYNTGAETPTLVAGEPSGTGGPSYAPPLKEEKGILTAMLFEAPEDDPLAGGAGGGEDLFGGGGADMDLGGGGETNPPPAQKPPVIDTPKINLESYTRAVARLINNYEALMDPKTTIFNRAKEYIRVNYDEATAKMFEELMEQDYNIRATEKQRDQTNAPHAANAIYGGGGGGTT